MQAFYQKNNFPAAFVLLLLMSVFFTASFDAQTKSYKPNRKKSKRSKTAAVNPRAPTITPLYGDNDAQIISRSEDYNENNVPTLPVEPTTVQPQAVENPPDKENKDSRFQDLSDRIKSLETKPSNDYDQKQKRLLLNLDILTRAESRAESLRKQLFEMIEKESGIKTKIDQLENDSRPENIDRSVAFAGTLRPEELRDQRAKNLDAEKRNLQTLLIQIQDTKANLETNVQRADLLVEKLRSKLEQDIDDSLTETPKN